MPAKFGIKVLKRKFLPPGLSYNICDAHFSRIKIKVTPYLCKPS
jgi:hypothetical protein